MSDAAREEGKNFEELSAEEKDFELARRLQEQEAAMFHFFEQRQNSDDIHIGLLSRLNEQLDSDAIETSDSEGWPNPGEQNEVIDLESTPHRTNNANIEEMVEIESSDEEAASSGPPSQIDDAEFARRLHLQEQEDHRRRLLTLAGFAPDDSGEFEIEEEEEEDDDDELDREDEGYFSDDSIDPDDMTYEELRALGDTVGVVSKGLSAEAIQTLPQAKYVHPQARESDVRKIKGQIHRGRDLDEQCAVCRMEFETKNVVKVLPCKHIFHPGCVDQWLAINKACPICGTEVGASDRKHSEVQEQSQAREHLPKLA